MKVHNEMMAVLGSDRNDLKLKIFAAFMGTMKRLGFETEVTDENNHSG